MGLIIKKSDVMRKIVGEKDSAEEEVMQFSHSCDRISF